jgi:hypothetical protein
MNKHAPDVEHSPDVNDTMRNEGPGAVRARHDRARKHQRKLDAEVVALDRKKVSSDDEPERTKRRFTLTPFSAVILDTSPLYLVKGLIPRKGLTVVWGPPKCGKSFWTFDMLMCVACGTPYRGRRVQQGSIVYLALEGGHGFKARIEAHRREPREHNVTDPPFYLITDRTDLIHDHTALIDEIKAQAATPAAVCIDTLNRSLVGSESKDEDMAAYIRAADAIREAFDCAVIIIHHCGVDASRPRGHTSLTGASDAQIAVERDATNKIITTVEWMKDGKEGDIIVSRLEPVILDNDTDGEPITSCVVRPVEGEAATLIEKKKKKENKSVKSFGAAFTEALDAMGKTIAVRGDGPSVRAANVADVKTYFDKRWASGETDPAKRGDAQRKAFKRVMENLPDDFATWVDEDKAWIWRTNEP